MSDFHGKVIWNELNTRDVAAAKAYYGAVCGWAFDTAPIPGGEGDYTTAKLGDEMVAGVFDITGMEGLEEVPAHWMTYFGVEDVAASVAASSAAGGQVVRPPFEVPGVGHFAIVVDATGAVIGLMQPTGE
ncbi:MAG: VOC family protein [Silicimonas sp.]|nr:VOC family protein [Silicimonas sp.]